MSGEIDNGMLVQDRHPMDEVDPVYRSGIRQAMLEALATPEVWLRPIGAVLMNENGDVVDKASNVFVGDFFHAEEKILNKDPDPATEYVLCVTKEPCNHRESEGHTCCAQRIIDSGIIRTVVILEEDENPNIQGKGVAMLKEHDIEVVLMPSGSDESKRLKEEWDTRENKYGGMSIYERLARLTHIQEEL